MTDEKDTPDDKPVTLADYIPPAPAASENRRQTSRADRERLEALERAVRETDPEAVRQSKRTRKTGYKPLRDKSGRKRKGGMSSFVIWAIVIMFVVAFVLD